MAADGPWSLRLADTTTLVSIITFISCCDSALLGLLPPNCGDLPIYLLRGEFVGASAARILPDGPVGWRGGGKLADVLAHVQKHRPRLLI